MTGRELEQLYNEAYKPVYWTAMQLLKNEADAEDVVQDTFIAFIESYSDISDTSKAVALLKKIAANKCLDRIKLAKTDNMDEEFFDAVEAVPEDFLPDSIIESDSMRNIVMDIIEKSLSDDVRRTLVLYYFDEMSTKEIAERLGIPQGSVLSRLNFARNKIKKEVEKYEKENNTKLFSMAMPFLSKLFMKEAEQVAFKPMPVRLMNLSASAKASTQGAGTKIAVSAAKKGTGAMFKIILGSVAGVLVIGAATAGIIYFANQNSAEEKINPVAVSEEEESSVMSDNIPDKSVVASDTDETASADILSGPNAAVLTGVPKIGGQEILLPCTVADLKAKGFSVEDGGMVMEDSSIMMCYDGDDYYAFTCYLSGTKQEGDIASDNDEVVAIELFMDTPLDFHGIVMEMDEKDFAPMIGMPAYVSEKALYYGHYSYYMGDNGMAYEFYFMNLTDYPENLKLNMLMIGTKEYMASNRDLAEAT